jgi:hypothetical protein
VVGDFNIDLDNPSNRSFKNKYIDTLTSRCLYQHIVTPTRITSTTSTLIDHVISHKTMSLTCSVVEAPFSDHHATFTIVNGDEDDIFEDA